MQQRHRVPCIHDIPDSECGCQLTEPCRQNDRVVGGELPDKVNFFGRAVRIRQRQTGLSHTCRAGQGYGPRLGTVTTRQPRVEVCERPVPSR